MSPTFERVARDHRGKLSDKWVSYLGAYSEHLDKITHKLESVLEIGVQRGGSLEIWSEYLPRNATVIGCDIDPNCSNLSFGKNVSVLIGDAATTDMRNKIRDIVPTFDVIVDDGSHRSDDIINTFALYFPLLSPGGVYIVEDLHCSYWPTWGGNLLLPNSAMEFLQQLTHIVNSENWIDQADPIDIVQAFVPGITESDSSNFAESLNRISSIEFRDSLCFIHTYEIRPETRLGKRVELGGDAGPVAESAIARDLELANNPESISRDEIRMRKDPIIILDAWTAYGERPGLEMRITELERDLARTKKQLDEVLGSRTWRTGQRLAKVLGRGRRK